MNIRNRHLLILMLLAVILWPAGASADTPQNILKRASAAIRNTPSLTADIAAQGNGGSFDGTLTISGNMFRTIGPKMSMWFDGKTLWSMDAEQRTTYISEPTDEEMLGINPLTILDSLTQGYTPRSAKSPQSNCTRLILTAKSPDAIYREFDILLDNATSLPCSIQTEGPDGTPVTIRVSGYKRGSKLNDSVFRYNSGQHPGFELVDMR